MNKNLDTVVDPIQIIQEVTSAINSTLDPDRLLELILDKCLEICHASSGSLMLINQQRNVLDIICTRGLNVSVRESLKLGIGEGITGIVAATGEGIIVNDVNNNENYITIRDDIQSELAFPMIVENSVIGVISLDSTKKNAFTEKHLEIVSLLANQAAQIFKNLQIFKQLEQKNKIQQVLIEISKLLNSTIHPEEIFLEIMYKIERTLYLERGSISLYHKESDRLKIVASSGLTSEEIEKGIYQSGEGITGKVFETGEPILIESIGQEKNFLNKIGLLSQFKNHPDHISFLASPIKNKLEVVGVISVFFSNKKFIDLNTYLDFLQVLASLISQAIQIQGLIEEETQLISQENILLKRELKSKYKFGSLIGHSKLMKKIFEMIQILADSKASVLITGESGTGKEMIASSLHYNGSRSEKPFIKVNCASIPENLLESELFGHKKGSFTGAFQDKKGKFELADGGTIFLDEIGEMDFNLQSKLLRVLQEKEIESIGSVKPKKVDIRIISATNANLEQMIQEKKFRSDLYYRLNVVNITMPSLKNRKEDIPLLIHHFIDKYAKENNKDIQGINRDAVRLLMNYEWPGNVRELENVIERAIVLTRSEMLTLDDFSEINEKLATKGIEVENSDRTEVSLPVINNSQIDIHDGNVLHVIINQMETKLIQYAMVKYKYTKTRVAKFLGINRNTLDKKLKELNIEI